MALVLSTPVGIVALILVLSGFLIGIRKFRWGLTMRTTPFWRREARNSCRVSDSGRNAVRFKTAPPLGGGGFSKQNEGHYTR